jgi:hypothetical protein
LTDSSFLGHSFTINALRISVPSPARAVAF